MPAGTNVDVTPGMARIKQSVMAGLGGVGGGFGVVLGTALLGPGIGPAVGGIVAGAILGGEVGRVVAINGAMDAVVVGAVRSGA